MVGKCRLIAIADVGDRGSFWVIDFLAEHFRVVLNSRDFIGGVDIVSVEVELFFTNRNATVPTAPIVKLHFAFAPFFTKKLLRLWGSRRIE